MKLSFVVPAYNEEAYIFDSLMAIRAEIDREALSADTEIIVVDNASTDSTVSIAQSVSGVRVVGEPRKGVSFARQKGLESVSGDIVAYIDADTKILPGWITRMLASFNDGGEVVGVSGPYLYYDLPEFWKSVAGPYQALAERLSLILTGQCVFGGNFAGRRSALLSVGGFDLSIPFYGEDTDIVRRLRTLGKFKFDTKLVVLSSARRFNAEGVFKTSGIDALNLLSETVRKRSFLSKYRDIR
ncbi:MAG: glycosyltransferase family A protein [Patescibacteria group bacterium]